ncbi:unnamed protein product [Gadus morhua 'NCC']
MHMDSRGPPQGPRTKDQIIDASFDYRLNSAPSVLGNIQQHRGLAALLLSRIQDGGAWGANSVVCKQRRCKAEIQEPGHGTRWLWNAVSGDAMDVKWLSFKSHRV